MPPPRIARVFGAVNIGSFRVSAMIAGISETGEMVVLGSGHRAAQGIKRGYVTDMQAATYAVRDAVERAEKMANTSIGSVWIGASGAGLASLSDFMTEQDRASGALVEVLADWHLDQRQPINAVYYRNTALAARITCFLDYLGECLAGRDWAKY